MRREPRHAPGRDAGRPRRPRRPRLRTLLASLLTFALLAAAAATAYRLDWVAAWLDDEPGAAPQEPTPAWADPVASPPPVAVAASGRGADPAKVRAALTRPLRDADLGPHVLAQVAPLDGGAPLLEQGRGSAVPASTTKLLTAAAALEVLGPDATFTTRVVQPAPGRVVLVGGGDPLLGADPGKGLYPARADLLTLARSTAAALERAGVRSVRVGFDDSLFSGPTTSPHWPDSYVPEDVVSPITALWADQGNAPDGGREADPSASAAAVFAAHLRAQGLRVRGTPSRTTAGGSTLAQVASAPLREIVQHTLETSDNDAAEVLAHHVGVAVARDGSFAGGATAVARTLTRLGVPTDGLRLYDGSGLSREDRISPATLTGVLQAAAARDRLAPLLGGLPVAGFTGSLVERFEDPASAAGLGIVRAKTGTLTGVHALAGTVTDRDGDALVLVLMTDRVTPARTLAARQALDDAAAALAACRCGAVG